MPENNTDIYYYTLFDNSIFKGTYWGNFKRDVVDFGDDIIENRKQFLKDFNLSKLSHPTNLSKQKVRNLGFKSDDLFVECDIEYEGISFRPDHVEVYKLKNQNSYLYLFNNYDISQDTKNVLIKNGYKEYPKLYNNENTTMYKIV